MIQQAKSDLDQAGFTTVELLVTLFVGAMFLAAGFQLYSFIIQDSASVRDKTTASNIASDYLNRIAASSTACLPDTTEGGVAEEVDPPTGTRLINPVVTRILNSPYGCEGPKPINRAEVIVRYGPSENRKEVRHAKYVIVQ